MKIKTMLLMAGAAVAGIYLTSEEGKNARLALRKKKNALVPIVKELIKEANDVLEGSKELNSTEIKENIQKIVSETKTFLKDINFEKSVDVIREAIKVSTDKINDAKHEMKKTKRLESQDIRSKSSKAKVNKG